MRENELRDIFAKTKGHCHFCGDKIKLEKRGRKIGNLDDYWEVDHVIQSAKGGRDLVENCLPACTKCNRLRWHRKGKDLRQLYLD